MNRSPILTMVALAVVATALGLAAVPAFATETYVGTIKSTDGGPQNETHVLNTQADAGVGAFTLNARDHYAIQCDPFPCCYQVFTASTGKAFCGRAATLPARWNNGSIHDVIMPPNTTHLSIMPVNPEDGGVIAGNAQIFHITQ